MPAATQQATFDELYKIFGTDYEKRQLMDWANYVKQWSGRNYYVWADLTPLWSTERIPYWTYSADFFAGKPAAGYLPAGLNSFYMQMRPLSLSDKDTFMKVVASKFLSTGGVWKFINSIVNPIGATFDSLAEKNRFSALRVCADVHFFDPAINNYRTVKVPVQDKYFAFKFYGYDASEFESKRQAILLLNKNVRECAKALSLQYNRAVTLMASPKFAQLRPAVQAQIRAYQADAVAKIDAMQNDPLIVAKSCQECAHNATIDGIGVIPVVLVIILAAVAIGGGVYVATKLIAAADKYATQKLAVDRINNDQKNLQTVLNDPNITTADKARYFDMTKADVQAASATVTAANAKPKSFFDRIENWGLFAGVVWLGGNWIKTRNSK